MFEKQESFSQVPKLRKNMWILKMKNELNESLHNVEELCG